MRIPEIGTAVAQAVRAEHSAGTGITFTDSQNLVGDPFVAVAPAAAATERLRFATGVTNSSPAIRRHLANIAATVQETSGGRFVLGIGAVTPRAVPPRPEADARRRFIDAVTDLQRYLANDTIDCKGHPSRLQFLDRCRQPKVPLDIAVSGPRRHRFAARAAERVTFAVGADPDRGPRGRSTWRARPRPTTGATPADISFGAYVTVGCHPDLDAARNLIRWRGRRVRTLLLDARIDRRRHRRGRQANGRRSRSELQQQRAPEQHGRAYLGAQPRVRRSLRLVGPPDVCAARLRDLADLGIERFVIHGRGFRADGSTPHVGATDSPGELLPAQELNMSDPKPVEIRRPDMRTKTSCMESRRSKPHENVISGGIVVDGTGGGAHGGASRSTGGVITEVGRVRGFGRDPHDRRQRPDRHARLRRHPHALRRPGVLGRAHDPVVVARRHHGGDGQLRRRVRAVQAGRPRRLVELMEGVEDIPFPVLTEGLPGTGSVSRLHGRARRPPLRRRHRGAAAARARCGLT